MATAAWIGSKPSDPAATPDGSDELPTGPDYPDLRRRVEHGVRNHTRHPANVFVSLQDGWHFGSRFLELMSKLKGTHGNARRGASLGIVVSNVDRLPELVPAEDVFPYLGIPDAPVTIAR